MEHRVFKYVVPKHIIYTLLILVCYICEQTPYMLTLFGVRPSPVIACVVVIAMLEGEFAGGVFGMLAGTLCDISAFHIFGIASILFLILGVCCGLLVIYLMQSNLQTVMILTFGFALLYGVVCHYLIYGIWDYEGSSLLLLTKTLPTAALSACWALPLYYGILKVHTFFTISE